jgi:hypothetical protein
MIEDGLKRVKEKRFRHRLSDIVRELREMETGSAGVLPPERDVFRGDSGREDLLAEKMYREAELRRLEGR